jgi:hypothetical protein
MWQIHAHLTAGVQRSHETICPADEIRQEKLPLERFSTKPVLCFIFQEAMTKPLFINSCPSSLHV